MPVVDREDLARAMEAMAAQKECMISFGGSRGKALAGFLDVRSELLRAQSRAVELGRPPHEIISDSCMTMSSMVCCLAGTVVATEKNRQPTPDEAMEVVDVLMRIIRDEAGRMVERMCDTATMINTHEGQMS